jgi:hypothetical protein
MIGLLPTVAGNNRTGSTDGSADPVGHNPTAVPWEEPCTPWDGFPAPIRNGFFPSRENRVLADEGVMVKWHIAGIFGNPAVPADRAGDIASGPLGKVRDGSALVRSRALISRPIREKDLQGIGKDDKGDSPVCRRSLYFRKDGDAERRVLASPRRKADFPGIEKGVGLNIILKSARARPTPAARVCKEAPETGRIRVP